MLCRKYFTYVFQSHAYFGGEVSQLFFGEFTLFLSLSVLSVVAILNQSLHVCQSFALNNNRVSPQEMNNMWMDFLSLVYIGELHEGFNNRVEPGRDFALARKSIRFLKCG